MSLPLTRRIAQAALVVAAGAVPVVAAGAAHAATPELPAVPNLGSLSQIDTAGLGGSVQNAAHHTGQLAGAGAGKAVAAGVPVVADAAGTAAGGAIPLANRSIGSTAVQATQVAGQTAGTTRGLSSLGQAAGHATRSMPTDALQDTAQGASAEALGLPARAVPAVADSGPLTQAQAPAQDALGAVNGLGVQNQRAMPNAAGALGGLPGLGDTRALDTITGLAGGLGGLPV